MLKQIFCFIYTNPTQQILFTKELEFCLVEFVTDKL